MFGNRRLGHIGLKCKDVEKAARWYGEKAGFKVTGRFPVRDGDILFIENEAGVVYELVPDGNIPADAVGWIEHICYESDDVERDYEYCVKNGYRFATDGIRKAPFWENGIRYFMVYSDTGEKIEYCQIL